MLANKMSRALIFCRYVIIMDLTRLSGLLEFHNVPIRNRRLEMSAIPHKEWTDMCTIIYLGNLSFHTQVNSNWSSRLKVILTKWLSGNLTVNRVNLYPDGLYPHLAEWIQLNKNTLHMKYTLFFKPWAKIVHYEFNILRPLRTFALIVSAHPYCARNS